MRIPFAPWWQLLRVHQWLKNLLLAVPLLAAHRAIDMAALGTLARALLAFSLCASAVYIANDVIDVQHDRLHPRKRRRPFAAQTLPVAHGVAFIPVLLVASGILGLTIGSTFSGWLALYAAVTTLYSVALKRLIIVDALTLAALYTLRIIAGAAAMMVPLSFWLLAFSVFVFLSLAFVKRYAELLGHETAPSVAPALLPGRGYAVTDAPVVRSFGIASGYAAVLVLALYIDGETAQQFYAQPELIWLAVPLILYWITRVWLVAHRGRMHDDPLVFAMFDRASWLVAALLGGAFVLATVGRPW